MIKKLIQYIFLFIIILALLIAYLSFFGISTDKFNSQIKSQFSNINKKINLELNDVKILLDPKNLSINVKTNNPKIFISGNKLEFEHIITNIPLKSFINRDFTIDDLQVSTKKIKLSSLISLVRSFKSSTELFILNNIIEDGFIVGNINLNFDKKGKIKKIF